MSKSLETMVRCSSTQKYKHTQRQVRWKKLTQKAERGKNYAAWTHHAWNNGKKMTRTLLIHTEPAAYSEHSH